MGFIIHYDIAAIVLIATILVHFYCKKTLDTKPSKLFAIMLWVHLFATFLDIGTAVMIDRICPWELFIFGIAYIALCAMERHHYIWVTLFILPKAFQISGFLEIILRFVGRLRWI